MPTTIVESFDSLAANAAVGSTLTTQAFTFSSSSPMALLNGAGLSSAFGWGSSAPSGNALSAPSNGWLSITATDGSDLSAMAFRYGWGWNQYSIELGLTDVMVSWQAWDNGVLVGSHDSVFSNTGLVHDHGGGMLAVSPAAPFDTLMVRSTATVYQGVLGPDGYLHRGNVLSSGPTNLIAVDDVSGVEVSAVTQRAAVAAVPDAGSTVIMFAFAVIVFVRLPKLFSQ